MKGGGNGDGYGGGGNGDGYGCGGNPITVSTYEHEPDIRRSLCSQLGVRQRIGET